MAKALFPKGIITVEINGEKRLAEYMGRQQGFECLVCGKGGNCYTFNLFDSVEEYRNGAYETLGFGRDHLDNVKIICDYPLETKQGERIQFRKSKSWDGEEHSWRDGVLIEDLGRCWRIRGVDGEVNEYWKHRVEIRTVPATDVQDPQEAIIDRYIASPYSYHGDSSRARSWSIWDRKANGWLQGVNGAVVATKAEAEDVAIRMNTAGPVDHGSQPSDDVEQYAPVLENCPVCGTAWPVPKGCQVTSCRQCGYESDEVAQTSKC